MIRGVLVLLLCLLSNYAFAHDSWISRGGLKNGAGEWCCGKGDCAMMTPNSVRTSAIGYVFKGIGTIEGAAPIGDKDVMINDVVPQSELQPSPDGKFWYCVRPDLSRRCAFGPPPGS